MSEPVLQKGATDPAVRNLQEAMKLWAMIPAPSGHRAQKRMSLVGFEVGGVDGRYGPKTEAAVKKVQQQFNIIVDGGGPQTWSVIDALENEGPAS
jgi:peptidoglycan hydrolase-like protein with peptidoglycan-binding domain